MFTGSLFEVRQELVLGVDEGEPSWQVFGSRVDLTVGDDGHMYIADTPSGKIFIVSRSGDLLGTFGNRGSGPGEYQYLGGMWWIQDGPELWLSDPSLLRLTRFTADGELIDTIRYGDDEEGFRGILQLSGRRFLGWKRLSDGELRLLQYAFLDDDFEWDREFVTIPIQRMWRFSDSSWSGYPYRFEALPSLVTLGDGRIVISDPSNRWITIYSVEGRPAVRFQRDWVAPPIEEAERREFYDKVRRHTAPQYADNAKLPETRPPFRGLLTDDESRIWVQLTRTAEAEREGLDFQYDIFDSEGRWLGIHPLAFSPTIIKGGNVYVTHQGDEEIGPRVHRYKLTWRH